MSYNLISRKAPRNATNFKGLESMERNMETSKYLQKNVVSMRNGRYVVPVKSEYRGEVSGIIHDVSSTGATVFVEPQAVVEANARILQYRAQEAQEIERILVAFTAQVAAIEPQFQYSYKAMLEIDVLLAKARLALDLKAFKPAVRTDDSFSLIRARHPLIDPKKCVPVDIALGRDNDSLIITGPITGGKTVTLKTAGLLCAMAQCGFLIPADERSEICVFDEFLVDIGDEQSIEQSLSTFSGHMKKITGILELAMPHTLVLLDELGAGTDPAEGAALAVAIIEELRRRGVLLMATTHYAELKVFALETKGVVNASCEFDLETLRPTYKLSVGVPGKSNAVLISETLGIPARLHPAGGAAEYALDGQFFSPEAGRTAYARLQLQKQPGETWQPGADFGLSAFENGAWQPMAVPGQWDGARLTLSLSPGVYRVITDSRLPNGDLHAMRMELRLEAEQEACVQLQKQAVSLAEQAVDFTLADFQAEAPDGHQAAAAELTRTQSLLMWLEEGREPPEHLLNELLSSRAQLARLPLRLIFFLRGGQALQHAKQQAAHAALARAEVWFTADSAEPAARSAYVEPDRLPLLLLCSGPRRVRYACAGYRIGSGDTALAVCRQDGLAPE